MLKKELKFLLVEDNDLDAEKLERGFKRLNITNPIVRVRNGYEALEILRSSIKSGPLDCPFVILLDINMPKMNGIEFLGELRKDARLSSAAVFVLTTSERRHDVDQAYSYNVCGYIVKPVRQQQMSDALGVLHTYCTLMELPEIKAAKKKDVRNNGKL